PDLPGGPGRPGGKRDRLRGRLPRPGHAPVVGRSGYLLQHLPGPGDFGAGKARPAIRSGATLGSPGNSRERAARRDLWSRNRRQLAARGKVAIVRLLHWAGGAVARATRL